MRYKHELPFGATLRADGATQFRLWAPSAATVDLAIDGTRRRMIAQPGGWHALTLHAPAGTRYQFVLPDGLHVPDPASRQQDTDVHGPSIVVDPTDYDWQNTEWQGRRWHEAVVYELHAGTMGGFRGVSEHLDELQRLGITAIEIMPIADFPGRHNWGYDGVLPFAPARAYGTPDELKALIDTAHGRGMMVILDVVYNHFGPDGAYLHTYAKPFFREDIKTPWGASIDFRRPEVRDYFIQNALYWLREYRFDGLRFDAVHAISEEDFLIDLARVVRGSIEPGRHIGLVLEHENNRARLLGGPPRFDAQWADDFHHCLHVLLTGENEGYYEDFQEATNLLVKCLAEGFAYQGQHAPHLGRARGEPSAALPTTAFVVCLQNHDQIGNRAMGDRLTTLAEPEALRAATALLLLSPFIPMLFMGEEWASKSPFLFFTDHNKELAELVREGRRAEFKHFSAFQNPAKRAAIPDPNAPTTFAASVPERTDPAWFDHIRHLLTLRRERIVPGIPGCRSTAAAALGQGAVKAAWRLGTGEVLTVALNLGPESVNPGLSGADTLFAMPDAAPDHLPPGTFIAQLGS